MDDCLISADAGHGAGGIGRKPSVGSCAISVDAQSHHVQWGYTLGLPREARRMGNHSARGGRSLPRAPLKELGAGAGGKGQVASAKGGGTGGPKNPGHQHHHLRRGDGRKGAGEEAQPLHAISYKRAKSDPLYRARSYFETARGLFGENSDEAAAAAKAVDEAQQEADKKKTPA